MKWLFLHYPPSHTSRLREKWAGLKPSIQRQRLGCEAVTEGDRFRGTGARGKCLGGLQSLETLGAERRLDFWRSGLRGGERHGKPNPERARAFRDQDEGLGGGKGQGQDERDRPRPRPRSGQEGPSPADARVGVRRTKQTGVGTGRTERDRRRDKKDAGGPESG